MLWPKLQSSILWTLVSNDFGGKCAHTARTPQSLADLGQIKAEILPNIREHLLVPVEGASWVGLGCFSCARQAQSITEKYFSLEFWVPLLTQDRECRQRSTTACRPAPSSYTFCHKAPSLANSKLCAIVKHMYSRAVGKRVMCDYEIHFFFFKKRRHLFWEQRMKSKLQSETRLPTAKLQNNKTLNKLNRK